MTVKRKGYPNWWLNNGFLILAGSYILSSCDFFKFKTEEIVVDDIILASVDNNLLKQSDLEFVTKDSPSEEDSANLAERYMQSWIRKQLMIKEAGKNMAFDEAELNRKLLDYKYALMVYEFEKAYVNENLNREVSEEEINSYYEENKVNFTLKKIIVRTNFLKIEKDIPQRTQISRLLSSNRESDKGDLRDM